MRKRIRTITETAVMIALLVSLQALTKPLGQIVTGSCVNTILAVSALIAGPYAGIAVALVSPVLAFLLGIAPQVLTVPAIMVGNTVFVLALHYLTRLGEGKLPQVAASLIAWVTAAVSKFLVLYGIVKGLVCGLLAPTLLEGGLLKKPMLEVLPATFGWPQLVTALIGGGLALSIVPVLRKALKKNKD